jgi:RNA polymerase sporulation-specific sigma factor
MAFNKVEICGVNTASLPMLTAEEKTELLHQIKEGDVEARERFIHGNLRLVLSVIKRFGSSNESADDLFQIGCIGLIKAIDNFDPTLQVKFSTYAVPMIIGEIRRYLRDTSSCIRISRSLRDTAYKAILAKERLLKENTTDPSMEEVAAAAGISMEDMLYALDAMQSPLSLYDPIYNDNGDTLYVMDQISDGKNREENWIEELSMADALRILPPRQSHIIQLRFFEGKTQMEVASEIAISQAQVSRLEKNALKTMEKYLHFPT